MQRYESDIQINTSSPEKKIVTIEKKQIDEKLLEFKRQLEKERPIKILPIDEPIVTLPIETPIDYPPYIEPETSSYQPVVIGGGGGGGVFIERDLGTGFGREQVFERDMAQRENIQ
jgi:hypothetical protein